MAVARPIRTDRASVKQSRYTCVEGIATYLGLSVRHVRRLVLERRIPHRKVGSLLRFDIDEVEAWMDTLRRGPDPLNGDSEGDRRRRATR